MAIKQLNIALALLWIILPFVISKEIHAKYIKTDKANYHVEDPIMKSFCMSLECNEMQTQNDGYISFTRGKCAAGIQYRQEKKENIRSFILKPVVQPEYGTVFQHKGMVLLTQTLFVYSC